MSRGSNVTPHGRRGSRVTIKHPDGTSTDLPTRDEVIPMPEPTNQPMASVGVSLTVGRSSKFAREKIEASAWCTLPCLPEEEAIQETYEVAYNFVVHEVAERADQALAKFFPELLDDEEDES